MFSSEKVELHFKIFTLGLFSMFCRCFYGVRVHVWLCVVVVLLFPAVCRSGKNCEPTESTFTPRKSSTRTQRTEWSTTKSGWVCSRVRAQRCSWKINLYFTGFTGSTCSVEGVCVRLSGSQQNISWSNEQILMKLWVHVQLKTLYTNVQKSNMSSRCPYFNSMFLAKFV